MSKKQHKQNMPDPREMLDTPNRLGIPCPHCHSWKVFVRRTHTEAEKRDERRYPAFIANREIVKRRYMECHSCGHRWVHRRLQAHQNLTRTEGPG